MPSRSHITAKGLGLSISSRRQTLAGGAAGWLGQAWRSASDAGREEVVEVLADLDFHIESGDRVGIMGLNGAGKTTLLRLMNGVFPPSRGTLEVGGRIQSLLNTSLGFNAFATVRENIYLRGTAMGLRHREIGALVDPILEFAGLQDKASHRLRTLSSGQGTRLGFAISTAIQPDIMLMDEWVGAGDETFVAKAKERLLGRLQASEIVVLASHSTSLLKTMCNKGLVLDRGRLVCFAGFDEAHAAYQSVVHAARTPLAPGEAVFDGGGEGGAIGVVERIELLDGRLAIGGWAVGDDGGPAGVIVVELDGRSVLRTGFERGERPDVREHLGVSATALGFRVEVALQAGEDAEALAHSLMLRGGGGPTRLGAPFHKPLPLIDDLRAPASRVRAS